jgi:hypothetical protein
MSSALMEGPEDGLFDKSWPKELALDQIAQSPGAQFRGTTEGENCYALRY